MLHKIVFSTVLASTLLLNTGCTMRIADMTVASTKNYNLNANSFSKGKRVTGRDTVPVVLIPLGIPNFKEAIDKAIESNPCAVALSDVVITQLNYNFLIGQVGYEVEGTQVLDNSQSGCIKN